MEIYKENIFIPARLAQVKHTCETRARDTESRNENTIAHISFETIPSNIACFILFAGGSPIFVPTQQLQQSLQLRKPAQPGNTPG